MIDRRELVIDLIVIRAEECERALIEQATCLTDQTWQRVAEREASYAFLLARSLLH